MSCSSGQSWLRLHTSFNVEGSERQCVADAVVLLLSQVPWHGPVYTEAFRFEERCEENDRAVEVVKAGLSSIPRYGPLWFSAMRLHEHRFVCCFCECIDSALFCCVIAHAQVCIWTCDVR